MRRKMFLCFLIFLSVSVSFTRAQDDSLQSNNDELVVLWTSDDPYLAERMVLMYTHTALKQKWFNDVTLIIWGPSAKMVSENIKIQEKLKAMMDDGVKIQACIACARAYNVVDELKDLGFEVRGMGKPLTDYLKSDAEVLTF
ncbi:MAG: DsrE family protein [Bacteroidales bacterium]|nr:DsrE family protein [Bacteroidales bacterium]